MKKRAQPDGGPRVPDYTMAFLEHEGYAAKPKEVRSTKRAVVFCVLGVLAALLAVAGIWYWSVSSLLLGGWRAPGSLPSQKSGCGCPSVSFTWAERREFVKTVNFLGIRPTSLLENSHNFVL